MSRSAGCTTEHHGLIVMGASGISMSPAADLLVTETAGAATIRTMRRGFARVMDHRTIIDLLRNGDYVYKEAREQRERSRSVPRPDPIGSR